MSFKKRRGPKISNFCIPLYFRWIFLCSNNCYNFFLFLAILLKKTYLFTLESVYIALKGS